MMDLKLLKTILIEDLMLRRINIRQVVFDDKKVSDLHPAPSRVFNRIFMDFKKEVRDRFDPLFLEMMLPVGSMIKGVLVETAKGHVHFGRQIGSYPLLVGIVHSAEVGDFLDIAVSEISSRSVTGFQTPFAINKMGYRDLQALPGVGKKRAAQLFRNLPLDRKRFVDIVDTQNWVVDNIDFNLQRN
jgi:radical SAM superfamily enzyme with C-terminal helix-hairpin-helix motif